MAGDPLAADCACLVGLNHELARATYPLGRGVTLGRVVHADVFLPDPDIARQHCRILPTNRGYELFADLGHGGVLVNGQSVRHATLREADVLTIGRFQLRVDRGPIRETRADVAPAEATTDCSPRDEHAELHWVIAARLEGLRPDAGIVTTAKVVRQRWEALLTPLGGRIAISDPLTAVAIGALQGGSADRSIERALESALAMHRLTFALCGDDAAIAARVGVATGNIATSESAEGWLAWGPAVDRAMILALSSARGQTWRDLAAPLSTTIDLARETATESTARVRGVAVIGDGRRIKFLTSLATRIHRQDESIDGLLVRLTHDPQTGASTLQMLSRRPLTVGEAYLVSLDGSTGVHGSCETSSAGGDRGVFRSQLATTAPLAELVEQCGFEPPEETRSPRAASWTTRQAA